MKFFILLFTYSFFIFNFIFINLITLLTVLTEIAKFNSLVSAIYLYFEDLQIN